ncbi:Gryzun, putative trafficking through golgi-domain-containing protein [Microdochium trichocladiopsis]|uniref:Gryzun, putative trafficking through golgi-domain-containing protein n=1 Tax=Microdochium trichocladiopsis TaxID=1682393 RepID=A0A9P8YJX6_9PEZI|nr:Gryzun, putative trafficking through golgi-domain-containing protein [Microdochium trichocladiopsis]KAH7040801.1 Gryzun, putative trafficking through golgi-domain-containing protein [Microdochium trichocladiopsis]
MDDYPTACLAHDIPLLAVSGLTSAAAKQLSRAGELHDNSVTIKSEAPPIETREAKSILHYIQSIDASHLPWNPGDGARKYRFKVKTIGRELHLPPRQATLPADVEPPSGSATLHSPFSPLSPGSTLYPDGLIDSRWLSKHQDLIPSVCLCFYQLTRDPTLATLHDNQLKTDINALKNSLAQSGYKSRLAVVILSDQTPASMGQFQERLENIKKGTGLDPKASLFVLPTQRSEAELETALDNVLGAVFEQACEYYRDLSRRVRKKKSRGIVPPPTVPPTTTSHTLSLQGWNVRYDFKTAVFAEFRQEMDVAIRSYEQAYETVLSSDILGAIPSWSTKFNDARQLADVIAIRILRCHLWQGQSTTAVRRWQIHHDRIAHLLEQYGRGIQNYGWKAFESRWTVVMAQLIEKAKFPELDPASGEILRAPEQNMSADRLQPWEQLHHAGYWYRRAARYLVERRRLARSIPEDDRQPPSPSLTKTTASKSHRYDLYMCPEPYEEYPITGAGVDHAQLIFNLLTMARNEYQKRRQNRLAAEVVLESCWELENMKAWKQISELLTPLWRDMSFRKESWRDITETLGWTLRAAAVQLGQGDLVVAIDWELMDQSFSKRHGWQYDIARSLDGPTFSEIGKPTITITDEVVSSFLTASFAFKHAEAKAGQPCAAQVAIRSNAFSTSAPVTLTSLKIDFDGSLRSIELEHEEGSDVAHSNNAKLHVRHISLTEKEIDEEEDSKSESDSTTSQVKSSMLLHGHGCLTIAPGQILVFEMDIPLREPGDARATDVRVTVDNDAFALNYSMALPEDTTVGLWHSNLSSKKALRVNAQHVHVLPRPPKMELRFIKLIQQYYTDEAIRLEIQLHNAEDADADAKLDLSVVGQVVPTFSVQADATRDASKTFSADAGRVSNVPVGRVGKSAMATVFIAFDSIDHPTTVEIAAKVLYYLVSDPATPITQHATFLLDVVTPFEANFDLLPKVHTEWPSLFDYEAVQEITEDAEHVGRPLGLAQRWSLMTRYASFAAEDLQVSNLSMNVIATQGGAVCTASRDEAARKANIIVSPKTIEEASFDIIAQKLSLDDRAPSTADLSFAIDWHRIDASGAAGPRNTTTLPLPRFFVTVSEPRVLARVTYTSPSPPPIPTSPSSPPLPPTASHLSDPPLVLLEIIVENPSSHFLTFGLTMDLSDDFAFSGAKTTTLNVLPIARRVVTYRLLPLVRGTWVRPSLVVRDKYFQKVLRIIPTEGMKSDKEGVLFWVPPVSEEEEEADDDDEEEEEEE